MSDPSGLNSIMPLPIHLDQVCKGLFELEP